MVLPAPSTSADRRTKNRQRGHGHARVRARPIYRGRSYKITKRCEERRFHLAPGKHPEQLVALIGYCLAYCANRYGIEIHAAVFMSNHYRGRARDELRSQPNFSSHCL